MSDMPLIMTVKGTNDGGRTHFDMEYIRKASALRVIALAKEALEKIEYDASLGSMKNTKRQYLYIDQQAKKALSAIAAFENEVTG